MTASRHTGSFPGVAAALLACHCGRYMYQPPDTLLAFLEGLRASCQFAQPNVVAPQPETLGGRHRQRAAGAAIKGTLPAGEPTRGRLNTADTYTAHLVELGRWVTGEQLEMLFRALDDAAAYRNKRMEDGARSCANCAKADETTRLCGDHLSDLELAGQFRALADDLDQMPDATTITTQRGSRVTVRGTATVTVHEPPSDWPAVPRKPTTGPALPLGRQAGIRQARIVE